jgi:hypothetical protein
MVKTSGNSALLRRVSSIGVDDYNFVRMTASGEMRQTKGYFGTADAPFGDAIALSNSLLIAKTENNPSYAQYFTLYHLTSRGSKVLMRTTFSTLSKCIDARPDRLVKLNQNNFLFTMYTSPNREGTDEAEWSRNHYFQYN